jgi:hypothetical protein
MGNNLIPRAKPRAPPILAVFDALYGPEVMACWTKPKDAHMTMPAANANTLVKAAQELPPRFSWIFCFWLLVAPEHIPTRRSPNLSGVISPAAMRRLFRRLLKCILNYGHSEMGL